MGKIILNGIEYTKGGGGASSLVGLTDVDISAPSDGQVLVYDANSSKWKNGGVLHEYTATEKIVGTWFGKPLYEKVITIPNDVQIDNAFTYSHGISDMEFGRIMNATVCDSSNNVFDMPLINNDGSNLGVRLNSTNVIFRGTGRLVVTANRYMYVTVQYTKTTD